MTNNEKWAQALWDAEHNLEPIEQLTKQDPTLKLEDAYEIQLINIDKKLKAGDVVTGKKIGLTSLAMQRSLNVDTPDFGILLESMRVKDGVIHKNDILQPRMEGELAFVMKEDLNGRFTPEDVLRATEYITPAIEVVGSRIKDWKLTLTDTVSDNASCGMYVESGIKLDPHTDIGNVHMTMYNNGVEINNGYGKDVMGNPVNAVVWLAECLSRYGVTLNKGDFVLAGALTAAVPAKPGDNFKLVFDGIGEMELKFEE